MAIKRRRYDGPASQAAGLDYLLRRIDRMSSEPLSNAQATGGYVFTGPIEPTFLVASSEARSHIRAVADFICDGTNDEEEIQYALDQLSTTAYGTVVLSEGRFYMGTDVALVTLALPTGARLMGCGVNVTRLVSDSTNVAFDFQITYKSDCELSDFSLIETGGI